MRQKILPTLALLALFGAMQTPPSVLAENPAPVDLRILAINDFHGYLRPPPGGIRITDPEDRSRKIAVSAGGAVIMNVRAFQAPSSRSRKKSTARSMSSSAATPIRPMSARSMGGLSLRAINMARSSRRST
jgi:2',3'-cyclic-nucleotide 2'-phosphodiesterase (5'-nucleotidase family)